MKFRKKASATLVLAMAVACGSSTVFAEVANSKYFIDVNVDNYGWSAGAVDYLCEKKIANGVGDNKFAPENQIKRCDFIVLLDKAFNFVPFSEYVANFSDIKPEDYYYTAVVNAKGNGVISEDYAFYPQQPITRGAAMLMLYRAMDMNGYVGNNISTDLSMYSDADSVRDIKTQVALATLTKMGIISGNDGKILFNDTMSRAEMAMVFYKSLTYIESLGDNVKKPSVSQIENKKPEKPVDKTDNDNKDDEKAKNTLSDENAKVTITLDGEPNTSIKNSSVIVSELSTPAVVIGDKVDSQITDCTIQTSSSSSNALTVGNKAKVKIKDSKIYTKSDNSNAIEGAENTNITIEGGSVSANDKKSYTIVTAGDLKIDGTNISSTNNASVALKDNAKAELNGVTITSVGGNGILQAINGNSDSEADEAEVVVKDCDITGDRMSTLFYAYNNNLKATIENCTVDKVNRLVDSSFKLGTKGNNANEIEITLVNQTIEGDVYCDERSRVIINLTEGSRLIGKINDIKNAGYVEINVEEGSTLELTAESYVDVIKYEEQDDIKGGYNIYYNESNTDNNWLHGDELTLVNGTTLMPY